LHPIAQAGAIAANPGMETDLGKAQILTFRL
jgi:hypothetical protein